MSTIKSDVIENLGDVLNAMASYAGGSIPGATTVVYAQWIRWVQLAQYDIAKRGFWTRCLAKANLTITANSDTATLPADFFKRNGIYVLNVGTEDWASKNNSTGQVLLPYKDQVTGAWTVKFTGYTPTVSATGVLWYFYNPPIPTDLVDKIWFDGEMVMFGALKEYFRQSRQPGSQDDARTEYENRFMENLNLEVLPTSQELMGWSSVYDHVGINPQSEIIRSSQNRTRSRR